MTIGLIPTGKSVHGFDGLGGQFSQLQSTNQRGCGLIHTHETTVLQTVLPTDLGVTNQSPRNVTKHGGLQRVQTPRQFSRTSKTKTTVVSIAYNKNFRFV